MMIFLSLLCFGTFAADQNFYIFRWVLNLLDFISFFYKSEIVFGFIVYDILFFTDGSKNNGCVNVYYDDVATYGRENYLDFWHCCWEYPVWKFCSFASCYDYPHCHPHDLIHPSNLFTYFIILSIYLLFYHLLYKELSSSFF